MVDESVLANASAVPHLQAFASHRERLTSRVLDASTASDARLCVLGAGNAYDLDLAKLAERFTEIHLVDIDAAALQRAVDRQAAETRSRLVLHAPVDLSGLLDRLDRWALMQVTPEELLEHPKLSSSAIAGLLPGPFEVVLSSCVLTQLQLAVFNVLSANHPLFEAVRQVTNLAHLRTMAKLLAPGGRALLATDVASDQVASFADLDQRADLRPVLDRLKSEGRVIYATNPDLLAWTVREDPYLNATVDWSGPLDAWLWHNGPTHTLLVYASELRRK
jgi:hypothetical protein